MSHKKSCLNRGQTEAVGSKQKSIVMGCSLFGLGWETKSNIRENERNMRNVSTGVESDNLFFQ